MDNLIKTIANMVAPDDSVAVSGVFQFQYVNAAKTHIYTYEGNPVLLYPLKDLLLQGKAATAVANIDPVGTRRMIRVEPGPNGSFIGYQVEEWLNGQESLVNQRMIFNNISHCTRYFDRLPQYNGAVWHDHWLRQSILPENLEVVEMGDITQMLIQSKISL